MGEGDFLHMNIKHGIYSCKPEEHEATVTFGLGQWEPRHDNLCQRQTVSYYVMDFEITYKYSKE